METQLSVWNSIAKSWHSFRQKPIILAEVLAVRWKPGKILDIGCGNGRNLIPFLKQGFKGAGLDFSGEMIKNAQALLKKNHLSARSDLKEGEMQALPYADESFDYLTSIASFHHLKEADRKVALLEMRRVLKKDGLLLMTVWNKRQLKFLFGFKDKFVPWNVGRNIHQRYYHLFTYNELKKLLSATGFDIIEDNNKFLDQNLVFIARRK